MATQIFINLPVKDLKKSMAFYEAVGFNNNPQFTDDTAACMVYDDNLFVMLLTHDKFRQFISKSIVDARQSAAVINALSMPDDKAVDVFMEKAVKAGGREYTEPKDYGFMRQRSVEDLDGHNWEVFYMDVSKVPQQQ